MRTVHQNFRKFISKIFVEHVASRSKAEFLFPIISHLTTYKPPPAPSPYSISKICVGNLSKSYICICFVTFSITIYIYTCIYIYTALYIYVPLSGPHGSLPQIYTRISTLGCHCMHNLVIYKCMNICISIYIYILV